MGESPLFEYETLGFYVRCPLKCCKHYMQATFIPLYPRVRSKDDQLRVLRVAYISTELYTIKPPELYPCYTAIDSAPCERQYRSYCTALHIRHSNDKGERKKTSVTHQDILDGRSGENMSIARMLFAGCHVSPLFRNNIQSITKANIGSG